MTWTLPLESRTQGKGIHLDLKISVAKGDVELGTPDGDGTVVGKVEVGG